MAAAAAMTAAIGFTACDDDDDSGLRVSKGKVEIAAGETATVTVSNGTEPYTVKSADEKTATATVSKSTITLTGVKEGKTSVMVTDKAKLTAAIAITVKAAGLTFDKASVSVSADKEEVVTVKGGTAPYTAVSKDDKTATVSVKDDKLTIKGVKAGTTTITVADKDKKTGTLSVTVK